MAQLKSLKRLSKFIFYVLGRKPAEFGLVPDQDGFVKIKELLKAVCEEEGLKYVRRSNLDEILITLPNPQIEIKENYIRAKYLDNPPNLNPVQILPKLLYTCVRRKAYPVVLDRGIFPMGFSHVILSSKSEMAERMGRRKDPTPVLLTVQTRKSLEKGVIFYEAGDTLYLAESIQTGCFTGPPLPKQKEAPIKKEALAEKIEQKLPGSFIIDLKDKNNHKKASQRKKKSKEVSWKKDLKRIKKQQQNRERPPWRR